MRKKSVFRYISFTVICSLLLFCILYFIPWPTRINIEIEGAEISQDGDVIVPGTVVIEGWELHYLFKDNKIVLDALTLPGVLNTQETPSNCPMAIGKDTNPYAAFGVVQDNVTRDINGIYISLQKDWNTFLICFNDERYFACSQDNNIGVSELMEIHKWVID